MSLTVLESPSWSQTVLDSPSWSQTVLDSPILNSVQSQIVLDSSRQSKTVSESMKAQMLMHNSGRYIRMCVCPTILILFKVYVYLFQDFFVLNFLKFFNKLCNGSSGLWSVATSISGGIFIFNENE